LTVLKKALVIGIVSLVIGFMTCNFFVYRLILKQHKTEFKKALFSSHGEDLEIIEISPSQLYADSKDLEWLDENKEIRHNGEMFDIVRIKNNGTHVLLYVINDKKEKALFTEFKNQFSSLNTESGGKKDGNFLTKLLTLESILHSFYVGSFSGENYLSYPVFSIKLSSGFFSAACPPPDLG
jgi:hypothetical protein